MPSVVVVVQGQDGRSWSRRFCPADNFGCINSSFVRFSPYSNFRGCCRKIGMKGAIVFYFVWEVATFWDIWEIAVKTRLNSRQAFCLWLFTVILLGFEFQIQIRAFSTSYKTTVLWWATLKDISLIIFRVPVKSLERNCKSSRILSLSHWESNILFETLTGRMLR